VLGTEPAAATTEGYEVRGIAAVQTLEASCRFSVHSSGQRSQRPIAFETQAILPAYSTARFTTTSAV